MSLSRRALIGVATGTVLTPHAFAQAIMGREPGKQLVEAIADFARGQPVRTGRVTITIEKLVDNGNVVPVAVSVDSPMTAADHVREIAIFNDRNPQRDVAVFTLTPRSGKAAVSTRMRLATSQKIAALARMSDGSVWAESVDVVVALAACIEGDT